jgi:hypothetical protein
VEKLTYIKANFGYSPSNITSFQGKGVTLKNPTDLVRKPETTLENVAGDVAKLVSSKLKGVLKKNTGQKQYAPSPEC